MPLSYKDPLEKPHEAKRINYANGVMLDEQDFRDEQTYHRSRMGRALVYLHGYGTIAGLQVKKHDDENHSIVVNSGLAIDRIGRLIELDVPYCQNMQKWFSQQNQALLEESYANSSDGVIPQAVVADLFIKFAICPQGKTPAFGVGNVDATDAFTDAKLKDFMHLDLIIRTQPEGSKPEPEPFHGLPAFDPDSPLSLAAAIGEIRKYKNEKSWKESTRFNAVDQSIIGGPEHVPSQNGTEVLLSRLRIPAVPAPMTYDTNGEIEIIDSVRPLCLATHELFWLINATQGNKLWP